jgi:hypothetical protein
LPTRTDRNKVFDEGPYFFNSTGLHLRYWTERFTPEKEDFTTASVWVRLYSLPQEFWEMETLEGIGNTLGSFIKISEITKVAKYTSYAWICVYMNVAGALPDAVTIAYQDNEWTQTVDYEHIPFRCRKCHAHGHLYRDFLMNIKQPDAKQPEDTDVEGFTKIQGKRRGARRQGTQTVKEGGPDKNKFQVLVEISPENEDHTKEEPKKQQIIPKNTPTVSDPQKVSGKKTEEKPGQKETHLEPGESEMERHTQENQTKIIQEADGYEIDMEEIEKQPKLLKARSWRTGNKGRIHSPNVVFAGDDSRFWGDGFRPGDTS